MSSKEEKPLPTTTWPMTLEELQKPCSLPENAGKVTFDATYFQLKLLTVALEHEMAVKAAVAEARASAFEEAAAMYEEARLDYTTWPSLRDRVLEKAQASRAGKEQL